MKRWPLWLLLLFMWTHSASGGFFDLSPQAIPFPAPGAGFVSNTKPHSLAEFKGRKVMLWLFSTWCHTCIASVKEMQERQADWKKTGLVILAVRNHNNGGYPGPDMHTFIMKIAPQLLKQRNWVFGESTAEMYQKLNAKKYPDIYFLIDEKSMIQTVSTTPTATMDKILKFVSGDKS